MRATFLRLFALFAFTSVAACDDGTTTTGAGGATTGSTSSGSTNTVTSSGTTSNGTTSSTSTASAMSTSSSSGTGGSTACTPNEMTDCYAGPPGTAGVGLCKQGVTTCLADGSGFGPCVGEVLPGIEDCATAADESCDGGGCGDGLWSRALGPGAISAAGAAMDIGEWQGGALVAGAFFGSDPMLLNGTGLMRFAPDGTVADVRKFQSGFTLNSVRITTGPTGALTYAVVGAQGMDFGGGPLSGFAVARFDASGAHAWSKAIATSTIDDFVTSVAEAPGGDVALVGVTLDGIDFGNGALPNGGFIATVSAASGTFGTAATLGAGNVPPVIVALPSNKFAVAFSPAFKILGAGTAELCSAVVNVGTSPSLAVLANGSVLLAHGKANAIELVTISENCTVGAPVSVPAPGYSRPRVAVATSGDVFLSWGTSTGHVVTRRTAAGAEVWTKTFASSGVNDQRMGLLGGLSPIVLSLNPGSTIDYGDGPKAAGVTVARLAP